MKNLLRACALLTVTLLAACGAPSQNQVSQEQAAVANVGVNQAVVTRRTGFSGAAFPVILELDGTQVASIPMNGTRSFDVPPGTYLLRATSGLIAPAELTFTKTGTQPVFFNVSLRTGLIGSSLEITQVVRN